MENYINVLQENNNIPNNFSINSITNSVGINATNLPNDVSIIQRLLVEKGYPVIVNGLINNNPTDTTIISIINFQTNHSLKITGNINPNDETFRLLRTQIQPLTESDDESIHQPFITNAFTFRRNANNANTLNVIFEGDSWLDYPVPRVLDLYDTISDRNQRLNLNSLHLAKFGETTSDMYRDRANFVQYISNYRIDRIYFSGGGNDVFPQLINIVKRGNTTFNSTFFTDQSKLAELRSLNGDELKRKCILYKRYLNTNTFDSTIFNTTQLNSIFGTIYNNYLAFGGIVNNHTTQNTIFYMHTYDYPMFKLGVRPSLVGVNLPLGPWIQPVFDQYGINDEILKSFIIIRLLDKFYALLHYIKSIFNSRGYRFQTRIIDYRGLLNSSTYWRDEIHPNSSGARRLATRVNF